MPESTEPTEPAESTEPSAAPVGAGDDGSAEEIVLSSMDEGDKRIEQGTQAPRKTLEEVVDEWFERFHRGEFSPPGRMPWALVNELLLGTPASEYAGQILASVPCFTRHMHAPPQPLPENWLNDDVHVIDVERFRVSTNKYERSLPTNWFGIEVARGPLMQVLSTIEGFELPEGELAELDDDRDERNEEDMAHAGDPAPAQQAQAAPAAQPTAPLAQPTAPTLQLTDGASRLPMPRRDHCPPGYGVVQTDEGFVAVWYGPAQPSDSAAVADAWRHRSQSA